MGRALRRWAGTSMAGSLGRKLVLALTAVGVAAGLALAALLAAVIMPGFEALERQAIAAHVERTQAVLSDYAARVEGAVRDYGDWNASYAYMLRPTAAFEAESFSTLAMANLGVEGMAYVAPGGRIVIARWTDGASGSGGRAALTRMIATTDFERVVGRASSGRFYARLGSQLAAIGVARVRRSDGSGVPRGFVLMARRVTSAQLSQLLQLRARIDLTNPVAGVVALPHGNALAIAVPVAGADGRAVAATRFTVDRAVSRLGGRMLVFAVAGTLAVLVMVLLALSWLIARLVLRPLARVEQHMQTVRASGSLALLGEDARRDEIGSLGKSFNAMLGQLSDLREQLEVQSFALGRNESAVAVMHNVRNALSPISAILSQGVQLPPPADRALVERAVGELSDGVAEPGRRAKLGAYVAAAIEATVAERAERIRQLQTGREAMGHVLEIIGSQQAAAHERPALAPCDVTDLVARNATIARYAGAGSAAFSFPAQPHWALANRLILSQVIGNLFANAVEAIGAGRGGGAITVTIEERDGQVAIAIRDDGEGFDPSDRNRLFERGFSTRAHKSGGLGLHWCANSMVAMNGALRLDSEGRGRGAVATLTLAATAVVADAVAA